MSTSPHTLLDGVTATADGRAVHPQNRGAREYGLAQVEHTDTASTDIQGRIGADMPWETITTFASSGALRVAMFPEMRAVTSISAGAVTAKLYEF